MGCKLTQIEADPVRSWFESSEKLDEFIGIRYARVGSDQQNTSWEYRKHTEFDGIGGLIDILRQSGEVVDDLPEITHPAKPNFLRTLRLSANAAAPRYKVNWSPEFVDRAAASKELKDSASPPSAVAWHIFSEQQTSDLVWFARLADVTVNSLLVWLLDKAIRPDISLKSAYLPWMIPVNLRGATRQQTDTGNHSSAVMIDTHPRFRLKEVHQQIYRKLQIGEHRSMWCLYHLTKNLPHRIKADLINRERAIPVWNIGSFSNLGVWDTERTCSDKRGFLFAPPVLRCQWIGAGCITYQGRLSLMIQAHPEIATRSEVAEIWMKRWVAQILTSIPDKR